jgi:hypothetical protein
MNEDIIKLEDVCDKYFTLSYKQARRKGTNGLLPIPVFRLSGTRKGPLYLRKGDLDAWVADRIAQAEKLNSRMRTAGAV